MKRKCTIILISLIVIARSASGQDFMGETGEFFLDFAEPLEFVWVNPKDDNPKLSIESLELKFGLNYSSGIEDIDIYLNDLPVSNRGFTKGLKQNFDSLVSINLSMKNGDNTIRVVVSEDNGRITEKIRNVIVSVDKYADIRYRNDYALIFATDEYDEWGNLTNPVFDASTIATDLEELYGFQVEFVKNPTKDSVFLKLREYASKSYLEHDQLFIFFAGHGQFDESFKEGFLVTKDSKKTDHSMSTYISHNRLRELITGFGVNHIFLVIDACFGGSFDSYISNATGRGESGLYGEISREEYVQRKLRYKTRRYLTSGGVEYVPDGRQGMHSPFARRFIEALRTDRGFHGVLTIQDIYGHVQVIDPEPRAGEFGNNEPGSDFVFVQHN